MDLKPEDIDAWLEAEYRKTRRAQFAAEVLMVVLVVAALVAAVARYLDPCAWGAPC